MKAPITTLLLLLATLAFVPLFSGLAEGGITSGSPSKFTPDNGSFVSGRGGSNPSPLSATRGAVLHVQAVVVGRPGAHFGLAAGAHALGGGVLPESGLARIAVEVPEALFGALAHGAHIYELHSNPGAPGAPLEVHILHATLVPAR